jgi:D-glycero-alpha-D-manno-heptose-7-phosphate kinase
MDAVPPPPAPAAFPKADRRRSRRAVVRARAPLRLGLAGGGTDLVSYSSQHGGAVLNATIDRYAFASIRTRDDGRIGFEACDLNREEEHISAPTLPASTLLLHRGVYERMVRDFNDGEPLAINVTTAVDAPMGSGLGSSSALVVALIEAYRTYMDLPLARYDVAHLAYDIERIDLGLAGGRQDQYSAAFGGINFLEFLRDGEVIVNPLRFSEGAALELESSLVVAFSGQSRESDSIIRQQTTGLAAHTAQVMDAMHQLRQDAIDMKRAILMGDIPAVASTLERSWIAKKKTAPGVTNATIEKLETMARQAGAIGAKVSGAGGGGFMMFVVPTERRYRLITALNEQGAMAYPVKFSERGSESWTLSARK